MSAFNIPNTIGYVRIALLLGASCVSGGAFVGLYGVSSALDFFDGYLARMFDQCTLLGSCLDMITDRVSTVIISLHIVQKRSDFLLFLSVYLVLDLVSHFVYFVMSALSGRHHKSTSNRILRIYYNKHVLGPVCLLSEVFFMYLYLVGGRGWILHALAAVAALKTLFHAAQLVEAVSSISKMEFK